MNISMKLNGMLVDSLVVFFRLHGPFEASFYEITFGRGPLREEGEKVPGLFHRQTTLKNTFENTTNESTNISFNLMRYSCQDLI